MISALKEGLGGPLQLSLGFNPRLLGSTVFDGNRAPGEQQQDLCSQKAAHGRLFFPGYPIGKAPPPPGGSMRKEADEGKKGA